MVLVKEIVLSISSHHPIVFTSIEEVNFEINQLRNNLNKDTPTTVIFELSWEDGMTTFFHAYIDANRVFDFDTLIQEMRQGQSEIVADLCQFNKYEGFTKFHHPNPLLKPS